MLGPLDMNQSAYSSFCRARVFLPKEIMGCLALLKVLLEEFLIWATRPVEVFLRVRFGVRGHGLFFTAQIIVTGLWIACATFSVDLVLAIFWFAAAGLAGYHWWEARRHEKIGKEPRYTWSGGDPGLFPWAYVGRAFKIARIDPRPFLTTERITRFGEPALCLLFAYLVRPASPALSYYLFCAFFGLALKAAIIAQRLQTMVWDARDARILGKFLMSRQNHNPATGAGQQANFIVQLAPIPSPEPVPSDDPGWTLVEEDVPPPPTEEQPPEEEQPPVEESSPGQAEDSQDEYLHLACDSCGKRIRALRRLAGRTGKCRCGHPISVTEPAPV